MEKLTAIACSICGGFITFLKVNLLDVYWIGLLKAGGVAVISGFMGLVGRQIFLLVKPWLKKQFDKIKKFFKLK